MKLTYKLILLIVLVATIAVFCGGWRWGKPTPPSAADPAVPAYPDGWAWD